MILRHFCGTYKMDIDIILNTDRHARGNNSAIEKNRRITQGTYKKFLYIFTRSIANGSPLQGKYSTAVKN